MYVGERRHFAGMTHSHDCRATTLVATQSTISLPSQCQSSKRAVRYYVSMHVFWTVIAVHSFNFRLPTGVRSAEWPCFCQNSTTRTSIQRLRHRTCLIEPRQQFILISERATSHDHDAQQASYHSVTHRRTNHSSTAATTESVAKHGRGGISQARRAACAPITDSAAKSPALTRTRADPNFAKYTFSQLVEEFLQES